MGASYTVVNDIINCKRAVNPQYALLFEAALGIPAHILTGLQADFDMLNAKRNRLCQTSRKHSEGCRIAITLC